MSGTYPVVMGDRGRLVVPAELRGRLHLEAGTPMLLVESARGLVLATREQVTQLVRDQLTGPSLVDELLAERRAAAAHDDALPPRGGVNLFDASALLSFLQGEPGADAVEAALAGGGSCSAASWSETAQKLHARGADWDTARGLLFSYGITVEPVLARDAERAARLWRSGSGLSLADRLCLATAERLDAIVWTADAAWGRSDRVRQIR